MTVVVASKTRYYGSVTPSSLNVETTVVDVPGQDNDYMVEGYIDLSALASGDTVVVREYISVDGVNYGLFTYFTRSPPLDTPVVRFHTKTFLSHMRYRVTVTQTSGTLRSIPYAFIVEVMGEV